MTEDKRSRSRHVLESNIEELYLNGGDTKKEPGRLRTEEIKEETGSSRGHSPRDASMKSNTQSPIKSEKASQSPYTASEKQEETIAGEVTVKMEPGQPPKLSRSTSQKVVSRPAQLFNDWPSKTEEAKGTFHVLAQCTYSSKYIGSTEHAMDCDCAEEWGTVIDIMHYVDTGMLTLLFRCRHKSQLRLWSRIRLHQSSDQNGVCWRLRVRS